MKFYRITAIAAALLGGALLSRAEQYNEPPGLFFAKDRGLIQQASPFGTLPRKISKAARAPADLPTILAEARKQGVPADLAQRVCWIESRCRLNGPPGPMTKHGRHYGAYQIRPSSAARYGYRGGSLQGMAGLRYGMAHLKECLDVAGGNKDRAALCHVAGRGALTRKISPRAQQYANNYVRWVANAPVHPWAGSIQVAWNQ